MIHIVLVPEHFRQFERFTFQQDPLVSYKSLLEIWRTLVLLLCGDKAHHHWQHYK